MAFFTVSETVGKCVICECTDVEGGLHEFRANGGIKWSNRSKRLGIFCIHCAKEFSAKLKEFLDTDLT